MIKETEEECCTAQKIKESIFGDERISEENKEEEESYAGDGLRDREGDENKRDATCKRKEKNEDSL